MRVSSQLQCLSQAWDGATAKGGGSNPLPLATKVCLSHTVALRPSSGVPGCGVGEAATCAPGGEVSWRGPGRVP